jgi:RAB protein geranylgeranyltransferase component A
MLAKPVEKIVTDGTTGKFVGVTSEGETVKAKMVIGDPSYFGAGQEDGQDGKFRVVEEKKVVRAICILKHPVPGTDDADSAQIIIPQNQVGRKNGESSAWKRSFLRLSDDRSHMMQISTSPASPPLRTFALQTCTSPSSRPS